MPRFVCALTLGVAGELAFELGTRFATVLGCRFRTCRLQTFNHFSVNLSPGQLFDLRQLLPVGRSNKRDGTTRRTGTTGAADSMNVVLGNHWQIKIDYVADIFDVESPSCNISCDQHFDSAFTKILDCLPPFVLAHIAVQGGTLMVV